MTLPDRDAARDWIGRAVVDRDGAEIGVCAALLADEATGLPEWMYAERGEETVVVPLLDATGSGDRVQVTVTRADADGAPRFGSSRELTQDQEAELYRHYGIEYSKATSDSLLPAAEPAVAAPTEPEPAAAGSPVAVTTEPAPTPGATADERATGGAAQRGRGVAAAVAVLAALAAAVAGVRLRRGSSLGWARLLRRGAPPPPTVAQRALAGAAAARARAVQAAAAAGPVAEASTRLARRGASAGVESARRTAVDVARRGRAASTAARSYTDEAAARLLPVVSTTGQAAWRAVRTGTDTALRASDAATLAVAGAVPRVAAGIVGAGRTGLRAVLTVGAAAEAVPEVVAETGERLEKGWRRVMGRLSLGLGFGVGYVLGARAGRDRYEQIKQAAAGLMERPEVQQALEQARAAAPGPLQSSIDKLTGGGSGRHSAETVDIDGVDVVVAPPPPVAGTGGPVGTDAPLPDPLIPPTKSSGTDSPGRP
ncbi:hypothetical protein [Geodermatophilus sp. DSM 45219]|uniref:hypothetical protein n=1 Tax=Geodermatophilus sp. DSM 45219 TaxID=1881103 RepID=UPI00088ED3EB|nr:hypothetical protein [Geodermatophilus sp. DSM 45219]SDN41230.1 hypothetical protein SAMN05428965_0284 [Geodermatophilus sp. DSM 45219]